VTTPLPFFTSHRRFWNPVEGRYFRYYRPETIEVSCDRCSHCVPFEIAKATQKEDAPSVYVVQRGEICGSIGGRGACSECGRVMRTISWPDAAYLQVRVPEGTVWAWNRDYVPALRARVEGDRVTLRHLILSNWRFAHYVSRLPRFAVLRKNRARILAGLEKIAHGERTCN
jgi:hypothetical protein